MSSAFYFFVYSSAKGVTPHKATHTSTTALIAYAIVLLGLLAVFPFVEKGQVVIWANNLHTGSLDILAKYGTLLGDGAIFTIVLLIAIVGRTKGYPLKVVLIFLLHGIIVLTLKQVFFTDHGRPTTFLLDHSLLHFVDGVEIHSSRSFPSGHTATAFAASLALYFMYPNRWILITGLIVACFVGFTRMYLLQHFYLDVVVGAAIGFVSAFTICYLPYGKTENTVDHWWAMVLSRFGPKLEKSGSTEVEKK